jgi:hypothetical protein
LAGDAKLIDFEIYDMTKDVGETNNLAGKNKKLSARLTKKLGHNYKALLNGSHVWRPQMN